MGLKTIYSNIKFFIFQQICILAKMVITFEPVGIFSCGFRCCTQENKFCHLNHVFYSTLGTLDWSQTPKTGFLVTWLVCFYGELTKIITNLKLSSNTHPISFFGVTYQSEVAFNLFKRKSKLHRQSFFSRSSCLAFVLW